MKRIFLLGTILFSTIALTACNQATLSGDTTAGVSQEQNSHYITYTDNALAKAKDGKLVLFFKANWCHTCQAADKDITANLGKIPENLTIAKVDYDNSSALKQKYGVTYQHTFVQVDENGNQIKQWNGGMLADIVKQVQ